MLFFVRFLAFLSYKIPLCFIFFLPSLIPSFFSNFLLSHFHFLFLSYFLVFFFFSFHRNNSGRDIVNHEEYALFLPFSPHFAPPPTSSLSAPAHTEKHQHQLQHLTKSIMCHLTGVWMRPNQSVWHYYNLYNGQMHVCVTCRLSSVTCTWLTLHDTPLSWSLSFFLPRSSSLSPVLLSHFPPSSSLLSLTPTQDIIELRKKQKEKSEKNEQQTNQTTTTITTKLTLGHVTWYMYLIQHTLPTEMVLLAWMSV